MVGFGFWRVVISVGLIISQFGFDGNSFGAASADESGKGSLSDSDEPNGSSNNIIDPSKGKAAPGNTKDSGQTSTAGDTIPSYVRIVPAVVMVIFFICYVLFIFVYEKKKEDKKTKRDIEPLQDDSIGSAWLSQLKTVQQVQTGASSKKQKLTSGQRQLERKFQLYDDMLIKYKESIKEKPSSARNKANLSKEGLPATSSQGTRLRDLAFRHRAMSISSSADEGGGSKPAHFFQSVDSSESDKGRTDEGAGSNGYTVETIVVPGCPVIHQTDKDNTAYNEQDDRTPLVSSSSTDEPQQQHDEMTTDDVIMTSRDDLNNNSDAVEMANDDIVVEIGEPESATSKPKHRRPLSWFGGLPLSVKKKRASRPKSMLPNVQQSDWVPMISRDPEEPPKCRESTERKPGKRPKSMDVGRHLAANPRRGLTRAQSVLVKSFSEEDSDIDIQALKREVLLRQSEAEMDEAIAEVEKIMVMNVTGSQSHLIEEEVEALEKLLDDVARFCDDYCSDRDSWNNQTSFSEAETQLSERGTPSVSSSMFMSTMEDEDMTPCSSPVQRHSKYDFDDFQNSHN